MPPAALPHAKGEINRLPCIFANALARRCAICELAVRPPGAGSSPRRAVLCAQPLARASCAELDGLLREKSAFVARHLSARLTSKPSSAAATPLTHIHCGGLIGLRDAIDSTAPAPNVHQLLHYAQSTASGLAALPWESIIRAIAAWRPGQRSLAAKA